MNAKDVRAKIRRAVERREDLYLGDTDAYRLVDGIGDGMPGIVIDAYRDRWLVQTMDGRPATALVDACLGWTGSVWWKRLDQEVKEAPELIGGREVEPRFLAVESGIRYRCDFSAGYSQGIFLDQRLNRKEVLERSAGTVLNLFSYTCGFSVAAASGGGVTTSLDLSQPYLDWGRENFELNGIDASEHYFCRGDALQWLERWAKSGRTFEGVVADPPTFSRSGKGRVWRVERDYGSLVEKVAAVVSPGGWALFCTNCRGVGAGAFEAIVAARSGHGTCRSVRMPPEYSGDAYLKSVWVDFA